MDVQITTLPVPDLQEQSHLCLLHRLNPHLHYLAAFLQVVAVFPRQASDIVHLLFLFGRHLLTHLPLLCFQDRVQLVELLTHHRFLPPAILLCM